MKIGYDEKTDTTFITEMTWMEAGVIFMAVRKSQMDFSKAGETALRVCAEMHDFTEAELKEAMTAQEDIIKGLMIARVMQGEHQ